VRQARLPAPCRTARDLGGLRFRQPRGGPRAVRTGLRAGRRAVQPLQPLRPEGRAPGRLRRRGQLEADLPELLRMPALPRHPPRAREAYPLHPDYVMFHTLWPDGPGRTRITCDWLFHPDSFAAPGFDPDDAVRFWDETNRQDWHICEQSHAGITSRAYVPGPYSTREGIAAA